MLWQGFRVAVCAFAFCISFCVCFGFFLWEFGDAPKMEASSSSLAPSLTLYLLEVEKWCIDVGHM